MPIVIDLSEQAFAADERRWRRLGRFDLADNQRDWNQAFARDALLLCEMLTRRAYREGYDPIFWAGFEGPCDATS